MPRLNNVAIVSNSAGTVDDPGFADRRAIEEALCAVGDRLLTDIMFGNLHGMLTVHVL